MAVHTLRCITSTDGGRSLKAFTVGQLVMFSGRLTALQFAFEKSDELFQHLKKLEELSLFF